MSVEHLCASCSSSIWCPTWAEYKCKLKERRIYYGMLFSKHCPDYKKRDKNFKESKCQCDDCLKNEDLWEEDLEDYR